MKKLFFIPIVLLLCSQFVFGQLPNSDRTLMYTQTGRTVEPGRLFVYNEMNFYTKVADFVGNLKPQDFRAANYWLVAGNTVFTYGVGEHFDASLGIRVYQDTHYSNEFNLPDDLFLTLRAGSFAFGYGHFNAAFITSFRIPTGEKHNYPFAEYASGAFEYSFMTALSFYLDPYFPDRALSFHYNIGIWNHNEKGRTVYTYERNYRDPQGVLHLKGEELIGTRNSVDLRMALAAVFPTDMFDFRVELSGILYLQKPDAFVYSAEEWAFLSPSIRYKPVEWASFDLGADFRLSPAVRQWTNPIIPDISETLDLPKNYPSWRIHLGANLNLKILKSGVQKAEDLYEREQLKQSREYFDAVLREKERSQDIQSEIESLKKLRKETEQEIKELKKLLEED
ncbi:hypothetical protein Calab_1377 [Caldithrix abyssi DSM 13497]|uniref:Uncharacterized protein n=1 Tax=Caldithrix abyssi DSM 13497 TaxID=880073 RepID=H1XP08_CALAY|nr:DUF4200 domain-containing protein [Caldithrix abyssi]APF20476.1 hypothetical protein Cabys_3730 [Caldithrix abyssi DSM 13497]EHO41000.1 hypothetical protein Calab_1377 [Caldithrix abyssi DSM 13497]